MIRENLQEVKATLKPEVKLVAVSKFHPVEALQEAYDAGQRVFGESHVQELVAKEEVLPKDIEWHFIGHLQTNKVKYMASFVSLIHAVDSLKLLKEIDKQAQKCGRTIDVLLQIHVAKEETKFGFTPEEVKDMLAEKSWKECQHVRIVGLMAMATNTDNENQIAQEFDMVQQLFEEVKKDFFASEPSFKELSMGMSGDYLIAQKHGSTMVRVGSLIFGMRNYEVKR
ncbi:MAG: YggS family pyridoxal phosphate-dependent enzyme [Bacteroidaceae bacterium]|nr:YggS family pyridoxal phosphate-dependent enzyme [Bacteroidaceae bacterium]